jgi:hypothetical protein
MCASTHPDRLCGTTQLHRQDVRQWMGFHLFKGISHLFMDAVTYRSRSSLSVFKGISHLFMDAVTYRSRSSLSESACLAAKSTPAGNQLLEDALALLMMESP